MFAHFLVYYRVLIVSTHIRYLFNIDSTDFILFLLYFVLSDTDTYLLQISIVAVAKNGSMMSYDVGT